MTHSSGKIFTKKNFSVLLLVGLLIWMAMYIKNHLHEFEDIQLVSWRDVVILLVISFPGLILRGLFVKLLVEHFEIKLKFKQWFGIMAVANLWNYLFPFGGFGLRAAYLKKFHNFPYAYFLSTMMATYIIRFLIYSVLGLICLGLIYFDTGFFAVNLFFLMLGVALVCLIAMVVTPKLPAIENRIFFHLSRMMNGWLELKKDKALILKLAVVLLLSIFVFAGIVYFALFAFHYQLSLFEILLVSIMVCFTVLLPLTPGSLGIQEGAIVFTVQLFGLTIAQGILVAGLVRLVYLIWAFTVGPLFTYLLMNEPVFNEERY